MPSGDLGSEEGTGRREGVHKPNILLKVQRSKDMKQ